MFKALFLDIGGVLLNNGWDRTMRKRAAEKFALDYEELNERHHLTFDTYEQGKLNLDEYLHRVIFYEKRTFTPAVFKQFMFEQSQPYPEMIELVKALKARHQLKIVTVSNEGRELTLHRLRHFGLTTFVDSFVSSCFVHYRKPDADIYLMALDVAQIAPEAVIYVDDRPMFVDVATGLGMRGLRHVDYATTKQTLAEWGLAA